MSWLVGLAVTLQAGSLVRLLTAEVDDLPYRAAHWDEESEDNQISFQLEWKEIADRLTLLGEACKAGQLTTRQHADYESLVCKVKDARPLMERMGLFVPPAV